NRLLGERLAVFDLVITFAVIDAGEAVLGLAEEGRQALEVGLFPRLERVVVALGTIEADAEEPPRDPAGKAYRVGALLVIRLDGHADKVRCRLVGPEPLRGDDFPDEVVVGPVVQELVTEPGDEPPPPVEDERPALTADVGAGQPFREVISKPA